MPRISVKATDIRKQLYPENSYEGRYGLNDLPEIYRGRIDALNITEPMEFIPGVGIKHSDRIFYVVI